AGSPTISIQNTISNNTYGSAITIHVHIRLTSCHSDVLGYVGLGMSVVHCPLLTFAMHESTTNVHCGLAIEVPPVNVELKTVTFFPSTGPFIIEEMSVSCAADVSA